MTELLSATRIASLAILVRDASEIEGSPEHMETLDALCGALNALKYYAEPRNHHRGYLTANDSYDELKLPGARARDAIEGLR